MAVSTHVPPAGRPDGDTRLDHLDGLRALAALYVLVFHVLSYHLDGLSAHARSLLAPLLFGHGAVDVFIVLSGFCLMLPVARGGGDLPGGAKYFFRRRARRILPPYYAALALSLLLDYTIIARKTGMPWDHSVPVTAYGIVAHLVLLHDCDNLLWGQINSPLWSVAVEWRIYFCFPLLVWAWRRFGPWPTVTAATLVSYLLVFLFLRVPALAHNINSQANGVTPQYLCLFVLGVLSAAISGLPEGPLARLRERLSWKAAAVLTTLAALYAICTQSGDVNDLPETDCAVGVAVAATLAAASVGTNALSRLLSWRPLVRVGAFAYSLYLTHFPVIQIVWQYLIHPLRLGATAALCLHWLISVPASVGVAYLFSRAFERPFWSGRRAITVEATRL